MAAAAVAVLAGSFALDWSRVSDGGAWDTDVYERYGAAIADGSVPYRDFRLEYPPGALPSFVLATELAGRPRGVVWEPVINAPARRYALAFGLLMIGSLAATIACTAVSLRRLEASVASACGALGLIALSPLLLGDLVFTRFDPLPAFLTAAAVAALLVERHRLAGLALGLGVATKLYPVLLVPLALAHAWRKRGRREAGVTLAVAAAATLATFLPFLALSPGGAWWPVHAQLSRGLQGETLGASLLSELHVLTFQLRDHGVTLPVFPLDFTESAGSLHSSQVLGRAGTIVGAVSAVVTLAVLAWAWVAFARGEASAMRLARYAAVVLTAELAFGRVLSPQFVIWLLPVVPLVLGRRGLVASAFFAGVLGVTHVWFPGPFRDYVNNVVSGELGPASLLLSRNLLLVGLFLALALPAVPRLVGRHALRRHRLPEASSLAESR